MPRLVFHHIDKCAGTTILKYLQNLYANENCIFMEKLCNWTSVGSVNLDANRLARAQFIHDPYGTLDWSDRLANVKKICFFRNPIDRLISNWWMIHRWTDQEALGFPDGHNVRELARSNPVSFFSSRHSQIRQITWNRIARHLACAPNEYIDFWRRDMLDNNEFRQFIRKRAEQTLRSLSFIGFQEDFERSMSALQFLLATPPESPQPFNIHKSTQQKPTLSNDAVDALKGLVDLDTDLVKIAQELYHEQITRLSNSCGNDFVRASEKAYSLKVERPPKWVVLDMAEALNGTNWHCREINGAKHSRWIGPTPKATLDVCIAKEGDLFLRFRVTNILSSCQIDNLVIAVDGSRLEVNIWRESTFVVVLDAVIQYENLNKMKKALHIEIDCAETLAAGPNDDRRLGIEICEIEIGPRDQFILCAPGTPIASRDHV